MPFSLADYILGSNEPKKGRGSPPAGAAAPGLGGKSKPTSPGPEQGFQARCVTEITRLLHEAAEEWTALEEAIQDLRAALEPASFPEALAAAGLAAVEEDGRAADGERRHPSQAASARKPARRVEERAAPPSSGGQTPKGKALEDPVVNAKLEEVLKLLRTHVAAKAAGTAPPAVEIPQKFAHVIASEVAGRLKESVLKNFQAPNPGVQGTPAHLQSAPEPTPESKRIPLGDIAGIIDQLLNKH